MARILFLIIFIAPLSGCYYLQAAAGQWEVIRKREPLNEMNICSLQHTNCE